MPTPQELANRQANQMSDHNAWVDIGGGIVSQNLQGPYAIKKSKGDNYVFDLPTTQITSAKLSELTGIEEADCSKLLKNFWTPMPNQRFVDGWLAAMHTKYPDINFPLGQGGIRKSFETNDHYKQRMIQQIKCLIGSIQGGAKVLSIQEQPYEELDKVRMAIFNEVMSQAGYARVDNKVYGRDVGIWAKNSLINRRPSGDFLRKLSSNYRGCAAIVDGCLIVNVHTEISNNDTDQQIEMLANLKKLCEAEAVEQKVKLAITGDMNLYKIPDNKLGMIKAAGFHYQMVKGQDKKKKDGSDKFVDKNYEAYIPMYTPSQLQQQQACSTSKMQKKLKANARQTQSPSRPKSVQSFTPNAEINKIQQRLQDKHYQSLIDSIVNQDKFKPANCYQYKVTLHGDFCVEGNIRTHGQSDLRVKGDWEDVHIQEFADHIVNDLGWDNVNLFTNGEYGIPKNRIDAVVGAIQKQAKGKKIDISINGEKIENMPQLTEPMEIENESEDEENIDSLRC